MVMDDLLPPWECWKTFFPLTLIPGAFSFGASSSSSSSSSSRPPTLLNLFFRVRRARSNLPYTQCGIVSIHTFFLSLHTSFSLL